MPRHPERAREVCSLAGQKHEVSLVSEIKQGWDVLVVDEVGLLFELYSLATGAFVGGSLIPKGAKRT